MTDNTKQAVPATQALAQSGIETASSPQITIEFEARRCIHSRFCVLWQPQVYKANVQGPWIDPTADTVEAVVAVAHNYPSGAIRYKRHDGGPDEKSPAVNLIYIRENGPLAARAEIVINGTPIGYRATLCRCGASHRFATALTAQQVFLLPENPPASIRRRSRRATLWKFCLNATGRFACAATSKFAPAPVAP